MFRTDLDARAGREDNEWYLLAPLVWEAGSETITVPVGFRTDLASIPQVFQSIVPVNGRHRSAAALHDYLFVIQDRSREDVDAIFLQAMEACGVRWSQRWTMYLAVRAGGWLPWKKNAGLREHNRGSFLAAYGLPASG